LWDDPPVQILKEIRPLSPSAEFTGVTSEMTDYFSSDKSVLSNHFPHSLKALLPHSIEPYRFCVNQAVGRLKPSFFYA
jgi:hypothetical protein